MSTVGCGSAGSGCNAAIQDRATTPAYSITPTRLNILVFYSEVTSAALLKALTLHQSKSRDIDPILAQCWSNVCDVGPPLNQHWVNVSRLLAMVAWVSFAN